MLELAEGPIQRRAVTETLELVELVFHERGTEIWSHINSQTSMEPAFVYGAHLVSTSL